MTTEELSIRVRIREAAKAVAETKLIKNAIADLNKEAEKSRRTFTSLGQGSFAALQSAGRMAVSLTGQVARVGAVSAAAGAAGLLGGLKTASGIEQASISYKALLGSQQAATDKIAELQKFAQTTPFNFTGLVGTGQRLLALGFQADELIPTLGKVGNAVAALGTGQEGIDRITTALGQMKQSGTLKAQDMNQLKEAGIGAWQMLADASGRSVADLQKLSEAGRISSTEAVQVLLAGMGKMGGGDVMQQQSKSLVGSFSNVIDALKGKLLKINGDGSYSGVLGPLVKMIERNMPRAAVIAGKAMDKLGTGVQKVVFAIGYLNRGFQTGGMKGLVQNLGGLTGQGDKLVPIWFSIRDTSKDIAAIWQNSLWPAIKNVEQTLQPFVVGGLHDLQGILHWMADHPTAASVLLYAMGTAIAGGAIIYGITTVLAKLIALRNFIIETRALLTALSAASLATTVPGTVVGAGPAKKKPGIGSKILGFGKSTAGRVAGGATAAVTGWEIGGWLTDRYGGDGIIKQDGSHYTETTNGIQKYARGGDVGTRRSAWVGEEGPELVSLPGGSKVTSNQNIQKMMAQSGQGRQVVFQQGSIVVSGTDVLNADRTTDILVQKINDRLARQ